MKNTIYLHSKVLLFLELFLILISSGCENDELTKLPAEYVKFELSEERKFYVDTDSVFQSCYETPFDSYDYEINKTFISNGDDFYSFSIRSRKDYVECPSLEINPETKFFLSLSKKLDTGDFVDFQQWNNIDEVTFTQTLSGNKEFISAKFSGKLYQLHIVRPVGIVHFPEGYPIDSLEINDLEFRFYIKKL